MARAWITDRWTRSPIDPATGAARNPRTAQYGKGSRWRVDWYELQADGSKKPKSKSFRTKALAEDFEAKIENDIRSGTYRSIEHGRRTVAAVSVIWLNSKKRISGSSRHSYEHDLRTWVLPKWGARQIAAIEKHEIEAWITELQDGSAPREYRTAFTTERGQLQPATVTRLHTVLSSVLGYAHKSAWIGTNPARGVELPPIDNVEKVYLNYEEVEALADAAHKADGATHKTLINLLAYSGLRINEALALKIGSLDLDRRRATVSATFSVDEAGKRITDSPKGNESRVVPLQPFVVDELRALTRGRANSAYVFQAPRGGTIHAANWRHREWQRAVLGAGLDEIGLTPHKLRHTAASMAISAGADVKLVQQMLGHKDATETLNTYGHLWPDRLDEVTDAVEKARRKALKKAKRENPRILIMTES